MGSSRALGLIEESDRQRREHERRRVLLSAQLHTPSTMYRVRIRDVSDGGARVEGDNLPSPGAVVCLQRGGRAAYGAMAWARGEAGGIEFDAPLDDDYFGAEAAGGAQEATAAAEPYRRPGFDRGDGATRYSTGEGWIDPSALPRRR